jgi:hypothetical protein
MATWEELGNFDSSSVLTAEDIASNIDRLQLGLNGKMSNFDFDTGSLDSFGKISDPITTDRIKKPEFYGAPSPRVESVISDVHYRYRSNSKLDRCYRHEHSGYSAELDDNRDLNMYQPIEGLSTTVVCREAPLCTVIVGSFYAHVREGGGGDEDDEISNKGVVPYYDPGFVFNEDHSGYFKARAQSRRVAECALFIDNGASRLPSDPVTMGTTAFTGPLRIKGTTRKVYANGLAGYNSNAHQFSFQKVIRAGEDGALRKGQNKISYRCRYRLRTETSNYEAHLYFDARNLVVDVLYK